MTHLSAAVQPAGAQPAVPVWRRFSTDLVVITALLLLVVTLWLPFGFTISFAADGWDATATVDQGVYVEDTIRPFVYVPWALAQLLSPNVFANANLIIAASLFGKAAMLYLILKRLTGHSPLALAAAAILIVIPVDTAIFNEGTLSIHVALFCYLVAVYALLVYWQRPRWYWLALMWLGLVITTGIYEAVYPLLLFTPLMLLYDQPKISRRFMLTALLWYVVPLLVVGRIMLLTSQQGALSYQSNLFTGIDINASVGSLLRAYERHFYSGWVWNWELVFGAYGILAGAAALTGMLLVSFRATSLPKTRLLLLAAAGLVILGLGFAPYMVTALRDSTDRTFFYASLGAAVTIASALLLLVSLIPVRQFVLVSYAVLIAVIVGRGAAISLEWHQTNINNAVLQLPFLRAITAQVPAYAPDTLLVVIDDSGDYALGDKFVRSSVYFDDALHMLYENSTLTGTFCYPHDEERWGTFDERCSFEPSGVRFARSERLDRVWSYDQVVAFHYAADGTLTLLDDLTPYAPNATNYVPNRRIITGVPTPARMEILFGETGENSP